MSFALLRIVKLRKPARPAQERRVCWASTFEVLRRLGLEEHAFEMEDKGYKCPREDRGDVCPVPLLVAAGRGGLLSCIAVREHPLLLFAPAIQCDYACL